MAKYKPGDILCWPQNELASLAEIDESEPVLWLFLSDIRYTKTKCEYIFIEIFKPHTPAELKNVRIVTGGDYWVSPNEMDAPWTDNNPDIQLVSESDVSEEIVKLYKTHKLSIILEK